MAGGWARDGAVQEQIDASVEDAVKRVREQLPAGKSRQRCDQCDEPIPEARRIAVPGVQYCVRCQSDIDGQRSNTGGFNRRGSKDSQLR